MKAALFYGVPPVGIGVYQRDGFEPGFDFSCWPANSVIAQGGVKEHGGWLYRGPAAFRPGQWRESTLDLIQKAREWGATGIIVDPEDGWAAISANRRARELADFGALLREHALKVRIGITSFPRFPDIHILANAAGPGVWGSPQIYGRTANDRETFRQWWQPWFDIFGGRVIPSVAGWAASAAHTNPTDYRDYLRNLPQKVAGCIVWDVPGPMPSWRKIALREEYSPKPAAILATVARTVPGMVSIALATIALVFLTAAV